MMRNLLLSAALAFGAAAFSQSAPNVHELAQRVDNHYNQLRSLRAGFVHRYQGMGLNRSESGTLLLQKPGRMRWDYSSPAGKLFLLDGKYAWTYSPGAAQVQRVPAKKLDDLRSPLGFLLGHTQLEKELTGLKATARPGGQILLTGVPRGQQDRVDQVRLTVTAAGIITAIEIDENDGSVTSFAFSNEQPNAAVPADAFRFTPPKGVPVIDGMPPM